MAGPATGGLIEAAQALLGIKISTLIAGLLGTFTRLFLTGGDWKERAISVFVGLVSVEYLVTPLVLSTWNVMNFTEGTMGYLVGMTAMSICSGIVRMVSIWARNPEVPHK